MAKTSSAQENDMKHLEQESQAPDSALEEGKLFDWITGRPVKDTDKEQVRQRIARAIIHEYGIAAEDMEPDFKLNVDGKNKKIDIAVFQLGSAHTIENLVDRHSKFLGYRCFNLTRAFAVRNCQSIPVCR